MIKGELYYDRIPTKSLRNDVRYLGNILGKVIKNQEGEKFFNLVEKMRLLSKANSAKKKQKKQKKYLDDAMMISIADISAAMENTG
jgi:phosphoenolpyruvate carboxylase